MSVAIKDIEDLNKRIEAINKKKADSDSKRQVWTSQLAEQLKKYKEAYGVDMGISLLESGKASKLGASVKKEIEKVRSISEKEYANALQVVEKIESGDIDGAWALLGVTPEVEKEEVVDQKEEVEDTVSDSDFTGGLSGIDEIMTELDADEEDESPVSNEDEVDDEDEVEVDDDMVIQPTEVVEEIKKPLPKKPAATFSLDDDDDDDIIIPTSKGNEDTSTTSIDDEDDEGDFGGFGSILKGTQFDAN